jgi:hypothetical protein
MKASTRLAIVLAVFFLSGCSAFLFRTMEPEAPWTGKGLGAPTTAESVPGPEQSLPLSERLTYEMKWLGISIGTLTTSIKGIEEVNGRRAYVLEAVAVSNGFLSTFYRIEDKFTSYMDVENLCTLRHEVHRREGGFEKDCRTDFDQVNHKAYYVNLESGEKKEFEIPLHVQDTVTASYYFSLLPLKIGERVEYQVCNNERNYRLLAIAGNRGRLKRADTQGESEVFAVEPLAELHGQRVEKGKVSLYYSWDSRRLPVFAVIRAPIVTSVTISLASVERVKQDEKK